MNIPAAASIIIDSTQNNETDFILNNQNLDELNTEDDEIGSNNSLILLSYRNPILYLWQTKGFLFGIKYRGLNANLSPSFLFNISLNSLENNQIKFQGLFDIINLFNQTNVSQTLSHHEYLVNNIGINSILEYNFLAKSNFLKSTVQFSTRNYQYLYGIDFLSKRLKHNAKWGFSFKIKYAAPGTVLNGFLNQINVFGFYQQQVSPKHLWSIIYNLNSSARSTRTPVTQEIIDISRNKYYNPNWGFTEGKLKFVNLQNWTNNNLFATNRLDINSNLHILTSTLVQWHIQANQGLERHDITDPRADYYQNLPSNQPDSLSSILVRSQLESNPQLLLFNWDNIKIQNKQNSKSYADLNFVMPANSKLSNIILKTYNNNSTQIQLANTIYGQLNKKIQFSTNINYQIEQQISSQSLVDLLGGNYYINWNFFAPDFYQNKIAKQFDIEFPDKIIFKNQNFGPRYLFLYQNLSINGQLHYSSSKFDCIFNLIHDWYGVKRLGFNQNGLFPLNSSGWSPKAKFNPFLAKFTLIYKLKNNLQFVFDAFNSKTRANANQIFIDPLLNNHFIPNFQLPIYNGFSLNCIWKNNFGHFYFESFITRSENETEKYSFYNDQYYEFCWGILSDIKKNYKGFNIGQVLFLHQKLKLNLSLLLGKFEYANNPNYSLYLKNDLFLQEQGIVILKSLPLAANPNQAASIQLIFQPNFDWYISLSNTLSNNYFYSYNPFRRTDKLLNNPTLAIEKKIILLKPQSAPLAYQTDLAVYYTTKIKINKRKIHTLSINASIYNVTNNSNIVSFAFEQLRFNYKDSNPFTHNVKLLYAQTLNFILGISYILN